MKKVQVQLSGPFLRVLLYPNPQEPDRNKYLTQEGKEASYKSEHGGYKEQSDYVGEVE